MKGRIFLSLFALPFAAVGAWMLYSVSTMLLDAHAMRDWRPVDATLLAGGYEIHSGDSTTWEAYAEYYYTVDGRRYTGDRVALGSGGDNIGDYQKKLGARLADAHARGVPVTAWIDPDAPANSILDRTVRWSLIGFKTIFIVVFGGVGFGLLVFAWRTREPKDPASPEFRATPCLANDAWQTPSIRSNSRAAMWAAWIFAVIWCAVSAPLPFIVYEEVVEKDNPLALLFPVVGAGLLAWAVKQTLEWRRFGATPVVLDPFPGSIGGHVGGTIETRLPYAAGRRFVRFVVTLTNIYSYRSGSGKNRRRHERAQWQDERLAEARPGAAGTRIVFRFDVPEGLAQSDAVRAGESYHLWRLNVKAELPGADLDRDFDIPVYPTGARSRNITDRDVEGAQAQQASLTDAAARANVRVSYDGLGKKLVYPMGRHLGGGLGGVLIGAIFAAAGAWLWRDQDAWIMGLVFGLVGGLVSLASLYMIVNSLEVRQVGDRIRATRRILGIPVRSTEIRGGEFVRFEKVSRMRSQVGGKHTIYYAILGIDRNANEIVLGEGFRNDSGAEAGIRMLEQELGLRRRAANDDSAAPGDGDELVSSF